jgi:predicted dehydrogenase
MGTTKHDVLVIGTGSIGERHLRCLLATGRATVAFVEPRADVRERVARDYGVAGYESLDEALARRFDAAVVCSPAPWHVPQARQLVEAGLHVLIEKPLSTSEAGLGELADLVARKRAVCGVAYVMRAYPELREMQARLRAGEWGRPLQLTVAGGQHFPTYRPAYRETYYTRHESGGGAIQDALTHLLNLGEWLAGPIDRLVCDAAHLALPGVTVEDTAHVLARQRPDDMRAGHGAVRGPRPAARVDDGSADRLAAAGVRPAGARRCLQGAGPDVPRRDRGEGRGRMHAGRGLADAAGQPGGALERRRRHVACRGHEPPRALIAVNAGDAFTMAAAAGHRVRPRP